MGVVWVWKIELGSKRSDISNLAFSTDTLTRQSGASGGIITSNYQGSCLGQKQVPLIHDLQRGREFGGGGGGKVLEPLSPIMPLELHPDMSLKMISWG